jgi:hypothetical protein
VRLTKLENRLLSLGHKSVAFPGMVGWKCEMCEYSFFINTTNVVFIFDAAHLPYRNKNGYEFDFNNIPSCNEIIIKDILE